MRQHAAPNLTRDDVYATVRRRLVVALATPLLVLICVGAVLILQVAQLSDNASELDQTNKVIAKIYELNKAILDQETGLRGYLLSGEGEFLEPYRQAHPFDTLSELHAALLENADQRARIVDLRRTYELWLSTANAALEGPIDNARSLRVLRARKRGMDDVRASIDSMLEAERSTRDQHASALATAKRNTRLILTGLLALAAAALALVSRRNLGAVAESFELALKTEREAREQLERQTWIRTGQTLTVEAMQGDRPLEDLCARTLRSLARYTGAEVGALFAAEALGFRRVALFGLEAEAAGPALFRRGEGLVGRSAEQEHPLRLQDVPADFVQIRTGTGQRSPVELVLAPARTDAVVYAVIELGFLRPLEPRVLELLESVGNALAVAVRSTEYKSRLRDLLEESQRQAEELQTQQEELRVTNEELQEQSNALQQAHTQLEERQERLTAANASLAERSRELERARNAISEKATELERASQYKSEFLANMSHELRTPLNSSLILSSLLAANKEGNLSSEQVKYAQTIHMAGSDLLELINDILDLSKIEAGRMEVNAAVTSIERLLEPVRRTFEPLAKQKPFVFRVELAPDLPATIETDAQRAQQVLKNLLSNAFKFTQAGEVVLGVSVRQELLRFAVRDTGIGIPAQQQQIIFEAFRQADGTTNRKYGGTGLGLSISRDLARLLGGDLTVESGAGHGSTFTLTLPRVYASAKALERSGEFRVVSPEPTAPAREPPPPPALPDAREAPPFASSIDDDRTQLERGRRLLLVVEDDARFAQILVDLAHEREFQCLVAGSADEGVRLAQTFPPSAVILDMNLPDHSGLSVLDRLKRNPLTRHVPVHVISVEDYSQQALSMGAVGYLLKPVQRQDLEQALHKLERRFTTRMRRLLIVEDDEVQRASIRELLGGPEVEAVAVGTVREALAQLRTSTFDCVVTDLTLPDASGFDLLETMARDDAYAFPPLIVYTGRSLTADEEQRLRKYSSSIIVKGARSPERLLDEVTLFLHQVESEMPPERQRALQKARDREALFEGRRILVVEDDVRNIFALSSVLEPKGAEIVIARNGREALEKLRGEPRIDLVLMDIMMPEMDGLTATREIRKQPEWRKLPIIALTAKAMRDDHEHCIQAGANDYIAKPLDIEMLLSLLRVWMPK